MPEPKTERLPPVARPSIAGPGFLRGRRCIALDASGEFLTLYEVRDSDVSLSAASISRLPDPAPWPTKALPGFSDNTRGACQVLCSEGHAMGGFAPTPRSTCVRCARNAAASTGGNAGTPRGRMIRLPEPMVQVEVTDAGSVKAAGGQLPSDARLHAWGAEPPVVRGRYQLAYSMQDLAG